MLKRYSLLVVLVLVVVVGCSTIAGKDAKSWIDMTPKEKSIFLMDLYGKQYDSYVALWKKTPRTEADQKTLEQKYEWLHKVYPYIDAYAGYAEGGVIPPAETEALMLELVNEALGI